MLTSLLLAFLTSTTAAELTRQADAWDKAIVRKDRTAIEANLAEDFRNIDAAGNVADRKAFVDGLMDPSLVIDPYTVEDFDVRLYGDVALLAGRTRMTGRYGGKPFTSHYRYVDVYARRDGRWKVVSVQITRLPPETTGGTAMAHDPEQRLRELAITLPTPTKPIANYVKWVRTGSLVYVSGHGPSRPDGTLVTGRLGADVTIEQGYEAARLVGINMLGTLKDAVGDLRKVRRVVKVLGLVRSADGFGDQPKVMNGFSDLMVDVFGDAGRHARSAVGTNALPAGMAVEVEAIFEVE